MKKILAVFAHPDDEAFGPGGTLAKYAGEGVEVHLLCATKGESGQWTNEKMEAREVRHRLSAELDISIDREIGKVREAELRKSASILGLKKVEFLGFIDGTLCNALYHKIARKIITEITAFQPQVILTIEPLGVSGHLDHMAMSMITTYSYLRTKIADKLYYHCLPKKWYDKRMKEYFVYFPEGYDESQITTRIDINCCWEQKVKAMEAHQSQIKDVKMILSEWEDRPKIDHFILRYHRDIPVRLPETDFFAGITV